MVADDVYSGAKHNGTSVSFPYLLEKMENKLIVPMYFGTKKSKFCFGIISFSSLESELSFDSEDSEINFDRARSTTVNSLLRALRAISSDEGEELINSELIKFTTVTERVVSIDKQRNICALLGLVSAVKENIFSAGMRCLQFISSLFPRCFCSL